MSTTEATSLCCGSCSPVWKPGRKGCQQIFFRVRGGSRKVRGATGPRLTPLFVYLVSTPSRRSTRQVAWRVRSEMSSRSEEHTSELQSRFDIVCRLLLEKKKQC